MTIERPKNVVIAPLPLQRIGRPDREVLREARCVRHMARYSVVGRLFISERARRGCR